MVNDDIFSIEPHELWMKNLNLNRTGRGYIIDRVIQMELMLNDILANYFCEKGELYLSFKELILNKEFFTLQQKINLFRDLGLHKQDKFKDQFMGLSGKLMEANNIRNKVAHLSINLENPKINIKLNNKIQDVCLNDKFLNEFEDFMNEIYVSLMKIKIKSNFKNFGNEKLVLKG